MMQSYFRFEAKRFHGDDRVGGFTITPLMYAFKAGRRSRCARTSTTTTTTKVWCEGWTVDFQVTAIEIIQVAGKAQT